MKVDVTKRQALNEILNKLTEETEAQWGVMRPQNMIEHLITTLKFSNGKMLLEQRVSEEEAQKAKRFLIYTDGELPKGLKTPLLGDGPAPFVFASLDEAKSQLNKELDDFEAYFVANPDARFIQPRLGSLDRKEWELFHNKHFMHHFKQFGLV